jgi:O-antigen/teichoic acid export membrane protein
MSVAGGLVLAMLALYVSHAAQLRHVVATVVLVALNLVRAHYTAIFKGESRFAEYSIGTGLGALVAILGLPLIVTHRLDGVLAGMLAQAVVETGYLAKRAGIPRFGFDVGVLVEQLKIGVQTLGSSLALVLLTTVDRTVMLERCGAEATGLYYLGANFSVLMPMLSAIPFAVLTPRFFERAGRGEDLLPLAEPPLRLASDSFAVLIGAGALAIPATVGHIWPQLADGNAAARAALFGTYPVVLASFMSNIYYAANRQMPLVFITLVASALGLGLATLGVRLGGGIFGAALGAAVAMYAYYVATFFGAYRVVDRPVRSSRTILGASLFPIVYAFGIVAVLDAILGRLLPAASLVRCALAEVGFLAAMSPFAVRALRIFRGKA